MLKQDINYLKEQQDELLTKYNKLETDMLEYQDELRKYNNSPSEGKYHELIDTRDELTQAYKEFKNKYNEYKEMEQIIL